MSTYGVMRQIQQWYIDRDVSGWVATASPAELLERAEFPLTADEAAALHDRRVDLLLNAGVHAFSLVQLSRVFGFDISSRWRELGARSNDCPTGD